MAGKKFAAEFALRRNVSALDKILIQDSDDDVVKYAYPPQIAALSGYAYAKSIADLPLMPSNKSIGYIVGQMLYIYVGMGGDTKDGLYQSVGFFVGPQGVQGEKGEQGERGEQGIQGPKGDNGGLSLQELDDYLATKQYVTGDTLADMLAGYVSNTSLMRDYVTIAKAQDVTGVKNFTAGVQFGGLSMYKSKGDTVYLDANLVVRGGVTAFGTNETISPSIFEALPIDGATLKRTENGVLYVDTTVVGGGGGTGGGISIADVESYLTTNGYATQSWVTDYVSNTSLMRDYVTIAKAQDVTGVKNFTAGVQFGGLSMYKSKGDTVYLDANLVVRGGVTAFGTNETISPSIFEALPIDGATLKRTENGVLYVDTTVVGGGGGTGGGISIADVESYLTTNGYITSASSITGNAGSASKLQNAVSLWGRTFDGSADLTGSLNVTTGDGYRINYNGYDLRFVVSGSSSNRGIWDNTNSEWLIYRNSSTNIFFPQGNIAIGSHTTPTERLSVNGNINLSGAYNYKIQGKDVVSIYSTNYYLADSAIELGYNTFVVGRKINFQTSTTTTKATTATLDGSGNFSITGVLKLPAVDSGFTNPRITFGDSVIRIGATTAGLLGVYASGDIRLNPNSASSANSTMGLWLKASGFNGINISAPTQALHVNGKGIFADATNPWISLQRDGVNWYLQVTSGGLRLGRTSANAVGIDETGNLQTPGAITMYYSSDKRLKENIRKVDASKVLMSLGGVYQYEYIDSEVARNSTYGGSHYGLIYQNVKGTALKSMCHEREDGYGALNYLDTNFISLIAGATMENISEVEKLKRKIRTLEAKVKQLEKRVA